MQSVQADLRYVRRCMLLQVPTPKLFVHICLRTKNEYFLQIPFLSREVLEIVIFFAATVVPKKMKISFSFSRLQRRAGVCLQ